VKPQATETKLNIIWRKPQPVHSKSLNQQTVESLSNPRFFKAERASRLF
jgi:hypothetical protein